jgi:hypothetical protein
VAGKQYGHCRMPRGFSARRQSMRPRSGAAISTDAQLYLLDKVRFRQSIMPSNMHKYFRSHTRHLRYIKLQVLVSGPPRKFGNR